MSRLYVRRRVDSGPHLVRCFDLRLCLVCCGVQTHLEFSKDFSKAIEDKQVAEQMAERAKFIVMKVSARCVQRPLWSVTIQPSDQFLTEREKR
jgi:hypothetical protein